eukprot:CAMPEP_0206471058 /NCGR_PEP_ID=MMETSP0324_2-20121206/31322_1 /ASSEMBLY_ACC=CAM_ASM_000836 /TAXON_ID=2866 /ORGANISM="Crypthecodinium cohnii, Strain Seligo" /LENGTH=42 /DNA_ID= /DNA_START= /DNA_END= /DNA_ORIENTATION=
MSKTSKPRPMDLRVSAADTVRGVSGADSAGLTLFIAFRARYL